MITVGVIRNGSTYLGQHLRKNDYWAEGEHEREGEWIGAGADRLGLEGIVTDKAFAALRLNQHPETGERLTARDVKDRIAFYDVQISAPKDFSVLAMLGDERLVEAFRESVHTTIAEMERYAAVRERRGDAASSDAYRLTANLAAALFFHDTSRELDPQLHAHVVIANATKDESRERWFALQAQPLMRASKYLRQVFFRELFRRAEALGYEAYGLKPDGFSIRGVEHLRERFSKRSQQVRSRVEAFTTQHGRAPSKKEVEILVRESRGRKLAEVSTAEVRARQEAELSGDERRALRAVVSRALSEKQQEHLSVGRPEDVLEASIRHVFERNSVAREDEVLAAALLLHPEFFDWKGLRAAFEHHADLVQHDGELTLREIVREEYRALRDAQSLRNGYLPLGRKEDLPDELTPGQRGAAGKLLQNKDGIAVLVGDAGTGKTTLLAALEDAHRLNHGKAFIALAPTTKARDGLRESGFSEAETVQRFLVQKPTGLRGRVVLVDEAGLLSSRQLAELFQHAVDQRFRVLLVGDPKQHFSVQRGDALRHVVKHARLPVVRLSEVLRQSDPADREISRLLGEERACEAFGQAQSRGMVSEQSDEEKLFELAAEHYARNRAEGIDTLVVIPLWDEIDRFSLKAREALRRHGVLGEETVERATLQPVSRTEEQKIHWSQYQLGDQLYFVRETRQIRRGQSAEVIGVERDGLRVRGETGREFKVTRRHQATFEVARKEVLAVAAGDRILIRARGGDFKNGEVAEVARVHVTQNEILLADGRRLPNELKTWTYAHALTSYRAQGMTVDESILVLGHQSAETLGQRQFYVGNTRYRERHHLYVASHETVVRRLKHLQDDRELATEFMERQNLTHTHSRFERMQARIRHWMHWQQRQNQGERQGMRV